MITYSKKIWFSVMITGHCYNPPVSFECFNLQSLSWRNMMFTQFNQLNLNSSFSIGLLINWLICWFVYRSEKPLLRVGLLYNIKVIDDTVRHHEEFCVIFSSKNFSFVNCPCQMLCDRCKNYLRNTKYFLLKRNLDSRSNLCNIKQSNFRKSAPKWYA